MAQQAPKFSTRPSEVIIDGRGHMMGRLASIVAKELLVGKYVTVVRCDGINISGGIFRNKLKWDAFKKKTNNVNPKKGPFHYKAPCKMMHRVIRGMVPHKTSRGAAAMDRLKVFDGVPHPYDMKKKQCVPMALKVLRLKPHRKFCALGDLATKIGWKCQDLVKKLEDKRRVKAGKFFEKRVKVVRKATKAGKASAKLNKSEQALMEKFVL